MKASVANKLDPRECDFAREYLESDELLRVEEGAAHAQWAVKGQLMRGGPLGTALVLKLLQRLTSSGPMTKAAVESFLSVVAEDSGCYCCHETLFRCLLVFLVDYPTSARGIMDLGRPRGVPNP